MSDNIDLIGDEQMYRENILEHSRTPRNKGRIADATMAHRELNHSCGDEIELYLKLEDAPLRQGFGGQGKVVTDVKFEGHGCAISQASVSMLTEKIKGMSIDQLRALTKKDVFTLLGIEVGMTRLRCALLGLKTLEVGLNEHLKGSTETIQGTEDHLIKNHMTTSTKRFLVELATILMIAAGLDGGSYDLGPVPLMILGLFTAAVVMTMFTLFSVFIDPNRSSIYKGRNVTSSILLFMTGISLFWRVEKSAFGVPFNSYEVPLIASLIYYTIPIVLSGILMYSSIFSMSEKSNSAGIEEKSLKGGMYILYFLIAFFLVAVVSLFAWLGGIH